MFLRLRLSKAVGTYRASRMTVQFPLLELPDELIAFIVEQVSDCELLRHLARSCRRLRSIAENCLYRDILLRSGRRTTALKRSLELRPGRAKALRNLDIACWGNEEHDFDAVGLILGWSSNLRSLMFESPACNTGDFEDDDDDWNLMTSPLFAVFRDACLNGAGSHLEDRPLQNLQKCMCACLAAPLKYILLG